MRERRGKVHGGEGLVVGLALLRERLGTAQEELEAQGAIVKSMEEVQKTIKGTLEDRVMKSVKDV